MLSAGDFKNVLYISKKIIFWYSIWLWNVVSVKYSNPVIIS